MLTVKTGQTKPTKPYPTFPLSPHKRGWCKKIGGKVVIIAGLNATPQEALARFYRRMAVIQPAIPVALVVPMAPPPVIPALPTPVAPAAALTVADLRAKFLVHKEREFKTGTITDRTYMSIVEVLGPYCAATTKAIEALTPEDFADYRYKLASRYSIFALDRHVTVIRGMFNWAVRNKIIAQPNWGDSFEKPTSAQKPKHRMEHNAKHGKRLFTPSEIRKLLRASKTKPAMRAIVLLGINCGLGNTDIAKLPLAALELDRSILDYPRAKTSQERRAILWPETVKAIRRALNHRPTPVDQKNSGLVFLTKSGLPWVRANAVVDDGRIVCKRIDHLTVYFRDLLRSVGLRDRRNFYTLRHTFRTIADRVTDLHAVLRVMGHTIPGMSGVYVQEIGDDRLKHVADYVRSQILGSKAEHPRVIQVSNL